MNIKLILISICLFLLGFISVIAVDSIISHPKEITAFRPTTPTPTPVTLLLPTNAFQGTLTQATGTVKYMPWDKTEFGPATPGATLYQTDEIATMKESSAAFTIAASIRGILSENTQVMLGSLLPQRITINQRKGTVEYKITDNNEPLSIKSLGALTRVEQGSITISIEDTIISIDLSSGKAKLAYINNDNVTHLWELTGSDTAVINDTTGEVETSGQLLIEDNE